MGIFKKIPVPGLRNVKTAVSILICLVIYALISRPGVLLAAVAVVVCMQNSVQKSIRSGFHNIMGTLVGGAFGVIFVMAEQLGHVDKIFEIPVGIMILIYVCNLARLGDAIIVACSVYLFVTVSAGQSEPLSYTLNRMADTSIGILVAVLVNTLLFRPAHERYSDNITDMNIIHMDVRRKALLPDEEWSGGRMTELFIYPSGAQYAERDFDIRVSVAAVEAERTVFRPLRGYKRLIMPLTGRMTLTHTDGANVTRAELEPFESHVFNGEWETRCEGAGADFNLIVSSSPRKHLVGSLKTIGYGEVAPFSDRRVIGFYALADNVELLGASAGAEVFRITLGAGDFAVFNSNIVFDDINMARGEGRGYTAAVLSGGEDGRPAAVQVDIFKA